jgi:hypothetical protein
MAVSLRHAAPAAPLTAWWFSLGERERVRLVALFGGAAALLGAGLITLYETITTVLLLCLVLAGLVVWRPRIGLYFAFGWLLLFEIGGPDLLMEPGAHFARSIQATTTLENVPINPLELLLIVTTLSLFGHRLLHGGPALRAGTLGWPMALFGLLLAVGFVQGAGAGGDPNVALWELRALAYLVLCYFLAVNLIRTSGQTQTLVTLALVTTTILSLEFLYRRLTIVSPGLLGVAREFGYGHESAVILSTVLLTIVGRLALGGPLLPRLVSLGVTPVIALGLLATERRAGIVALAVSGLLLSIVFLAGHRRTFFLIALPLLVVSSLYVPTFWHRGGIWSQPARAVRSLITPDPRDAASNRYRDLEAVNIRATLDSDPVLGVGFGKPFKFVVALPDLSWWPFWRYEPHNNLLWVWLKAGAAGFVCFIYLLGTAIARTAHAFKRFPEPRLRTFCLLALSATIMTLTFCWVDLGLVSMRLTVFLGTLLGTVGALESIVTTPEAARVAQEPAWRLR